MRKMSVLALSLFASVSLVGVWGLIATSTNSASPQVAGVTTTIPAYVTTPRSALVQEINRIREENDSLALLEDARVSDVAKKRHGDMVAKYYYAHTSPDGTTFDDLFSEAGISSSLTACENLLMTIQLNPVEQVQEWIASPSHASCLLNPEMRYIGYSEGLFDETTGQQLLVTIFTDGL